MTAVVRKIALKFQTEIFLVSRQDLTNFHSYKFSLKVTWIEICEFWQLD
jgi:hypothetical protein